MEHGSNDTPEASDPSPDHPAPATADEIQELTDVIDLALRMLAENPAPGVTQQRPVHTGTDRAELRQMWLIEDLRPETEVWLDSCGDIWHVENGNDPEQRRLDISRLDTGGASFCKSIVLSFMATLTP